MNWKSINFDWNRAKAFLVTAEEGSLTAAAKSLGVAQTTLSRQVAALEQELSVVLFERGGRGLELTHAGLKLIEYVKGMGEAANNLSLAANSRSTTIEGSITISASEITAAFILPSILKKINLQYPRMIFNLVSSNEASDLRRQDADIAIRHFRPKELDLIVRKVGQFSSALYVSKEKYTNKEDKSICTDSLMYIGSLSNNSAYISALSILGLSLDETRFIARTDSHNCHLEMTKAGIGVGMLPTEIGESNPDLIKVREDIRFIGDVWLVSHQELKMNIRVRKIFDILYDELHMYYKDAFKI